MRTREISERRLALKASGIEPNELGNPCAAVIVHRTATRARLYRKGRGPYHGRERPGGRLVHFAYVVARTDNRDGFGSHERGTSPVSRTE
jgi:hypothetical protein